MQRSPNNPLLQWEEAFAPRSVASARINCQKLNTKVGLIMQMLPSTIAISAFSLKLALSRNIGSAAALDQAK